MKKETAITLPKEATAKFVAIKTQDDLQKAVSILSVLNKTLDLLTEKKEMLTRPINVALKEIRARYKEPETILQGKIDEVRALMTDYQTKQVALQEAKESKLAEKLASGEISIEKATDKLSKLPDIAKRTESDDGSVKFKSVKKFEVVDLAKLPIEYHEANLVLLRADMLKGVEVSGVRYFTEQVPFNSR